MTVEILENEYWYGGATEFGVKMPFGKGSSFTLDLNNPGGFGDQSSPLLLSSKGRYICAAQPFKAVFGNGKIEFNCEVEVVDGFKTLKGAQAAAAKRFFELGGKTPNLLFMQKPQFNTWIELRYNQNQRDIISYARSLLDGGMDGGVFMIDEGWAPEYGDFDFDGRKFSDPKAMVKELHGMGFKVMLWVTPYISPDGYAFREIMKADERMLLHDGEGNLALRKWWNGYSCVLDLTYAGACEWYKAKLDGTIKKYGVDGFKFDGGNAYMYRRSDKAAVPGEPCEHTRAFDKFCAQYEFNELRLVYDCPGQPIICRLVDKKPDWEEKGLAAIVPNTLIQGLLGYYYCCPDMIGGGVASAFDGVASVDEELYLRWLAASVLCPMMQFSMSPKRILSPDSFAKAVSLTALHMKYADKIVELAKNAAVTGEPIVRMMEYEFPGEGMERVMDQFMLGDDTLVAPVTERGALTRTVALPRGRWQNSDGTIIDGGACVRMSSPLGSLIILTKID